MKRLILLCYISMLTSICYAQTSGIPPDVSEPTPDKKNIVTDFTYSLKENSKVHLQWKMNGSDTIEFCSIERSANGKDFEMIEMLKSPASNKFELMDESPLPGRSYYRIRTVVKGMPLYSPTLAVYMGGDVPFKFYPNPADNVLIVRTNLPMDIQITDATGESRISYQKVQGLQTINVSSLEKGIYMIRFTNKVSNTVSTERLFKN
jgi:Secretion system C-terminal sorting domain